jgi:diacylglycerol kinase (ATP)
VRKTGWGVSAEQGPLHHSFQHAFQGVLFFLRTQRNIRLMFLAAAAVFALAAWQEVAAWKWAALIVAVVSVLSAEMLNTALEAVVDLASPDYHELAKRAKDVAAGAVLVSVIGALALAALVIWG